VKGMLTKVSLNSCRRAQVAMASSMQIWHGMPYIQG
jgi:hypothetical protein